MPVIKSAKKQMRQAAKKRARNFPVRNEMKTVVKKALKLAKESPEEAAKFLSHAYSVIDMAAKKNIIHKSNAARKKSRIARALNASNESGEKIKAEKAPAKEAKKEANKEANKEDAKA